METKPTQYALITGATSGIGYELAKLFANDGDFFHKAQMESSKIVQEGGMADPADVAKDGYDALMAGDDKVISGLKNKMQVAMSNLMPESMVAANVGKQQQPADN